ncbi:hypothetical protein KY312_01550 [Candidatus Woesearchaeota archaeon]|nr:hypothetical protein [Candidatus Woesearchaeota archaeon]
MRYRLAIIRYKGNVALNCHDVYFEYYICDLETRRAVAYRCNSPLDLTEDYDVREDFDFDSFFERAKRVHGKSEEKRKRFEALGSPTARPYFFQLRKVQEVEVYEEYFETLFANYKNTQSEKKRFEPRLNSLFDFE